MRRSKRIAGVAAIAIAGALGYFVYSTVWGTPLWFNGLLDRQAAIALLQQPLLRTQTGIFDIGWLDFTSGDLGAYSLEVRQADFDQLRTFKAEIEQWDRSKLSSQERLSYDALLWGYDSRLADEKYAWLSAQNQLYAVNQAFGVQKTVPDMLVLDQKVSNVPSANKYIKRIEALGSLLDAVKTDVSRQAEHGVIPPDFIIEESIEQMTSMIQSSPASSPLVKNLADRTAALNMDAKAREKLNDKAMAAIKNIVDPAYLRLIDEERGLLPRASHDAGVWRFKDGNAYYADQLRYLTSTNMTPDQIHEYGLSEVARISMQMETLLTSMDFKQGSVGARMAKLMADPRFIHGNTEGDRSRMLERYKQILDQVKPMLPKYFANVPAISLDVRRMPLAGESDLAGAYYNPPSFDGRRAGIFLANLSNANEMPSWAMPSLAYHEGIPGHHLQTSIMEQNHNLPLLLRFQSVPAYEEGWALYAEYFASEMGLYKGDPYGDLGRLQAELLRATRLVVDTGMHAKHWSREQAIQYMQLTTGMSLPEVTLEVDRYVVWPGQACTYTIGMKVILGLREHAMAQLGPKFNLREFHSQILGNGALPLWLLQQKLDRWIANNRPSQNLEVAGGLGQ